MAFFPKPLGQSRPAAATLTAVYTVPVATTATVSSIMIHNTHVTNADIATITVAPLGAVDATVHQVYRLSVPTESTWTFTVGMTLRATDVIRVRSENGTSNFHVYGIEEA